MRRRLRPSRLRRVAQACRRRGPRRSSGDAGPCWRDVPAPCACKPRRCPGRRVGPTPRTSQQRRLHQVLGLTAVAGQQVARADEARPTGCDERRVRLVAPGRTCHVPTSRREGEALNPSGGSLAARTARRRGRGGCRGGRYGARCGRSGAGGPGHRPGPGAQTPPTAVINISMPYRSATRAALMHRTIGRVVWRRRRGRPSVRRTPTQPRETRHAAQAGGDRGRPHRVSERLHDRRRRAARAVSEVMDKTGMLANTASAVEAARAAGATIIHAPIAFAEGYGRSLTSRTGSSRASSTPTPSSRAPGARTSPLRSARSRATSSSRASAASTRSPRRTSTSSSGARASRTSRSAGSSPTVASSPRCGARTRRASTS